jgi:hypothetical protein
VELIWIACGLAGAFSIYMFRALTGGTGYGRLADYALGLVIATLCVKFAIVTGLNPVQRPAGLPLAAYLGSGIVLAVARTYRTADVVTWFARQRRR